MEEITSERFLDLVYRSGLVEPSTYDRLMSPLRKAADGCVSEDLQELVDIFLQQELLTDWHVEKLLAGKYKGFFLGKYKLLEHINSGGMSSVYLAEHTTMHDKRAIKVLPRNRVSDSSYLQRFQREARTIAALNHPNIVRAFDIDNQQDVHYIVMEYVEGDDLHSHVKQNGVFSFFDAAQIIIQAARGLQHAHDQGVVHRDIKPANLLLDKRKCVRLLDMGLALFADHGENSLTIEHDENVLGTADYLAPEQALNSHQVDHRADIYGLGCTLYFMLAGHPPFPDGTLAQRIAKHQSEMPVALRKVRSDCPGELEGIVVKMIQKDPAYRYGSAAQIAIALEHWLSTWKEGSAPDSISLGEETSTAIPNGSNKGRVSDPLSDRSNEGSNHSSDASRLTEQAQRPLNYVTRTEGSAGLSPSESGRLMDVAEWEYDITDNGVIDLEAESGYGPSVPDNANTEPAVETGKKSNRSVRLNFAFVAVFVIGMTLGFVLAKLTS